MRFTKGFTYMSKPYGWRAKFLEEAKEMERNQHGNTWDAAIKAHDDRGHVFVRSTCDFDDYVIS